ncbi:hypothetical protein CBS147339_7612 [Penicillium roqueforti]|uniref:uncharacterized protein n=1 Tax=Penicillium roqueforti TaxID=5082 RepID=UPI00190BCBE9|nr:uncharacterized protein LCP9604111_9577 [Penicillium roqueforti]KAF9238003.1 hypothetical protein LCP9604111_9577 [Penicillium roqueforti]KAI2671654.1 hypothetical protein LCP963914a_9583 [Penicillium roqueforti]KAI2710543.1 hypothetical protein CBS147354_8630 [Penicillium roqueforti]KAI2743200.1 hypothetical protein DTO012A8_9942 [Penicillium roqueforti]KAI3070099.1 hypothetical protein CBS147339_7612 [Penicillium roqueforti]
MAPRLPPSKLEMIHDMILSKSLNTSQMAEAAECSERSIINIRNNLHQFGNVRAPPTRVGRQRSITPPMLEAVCDHLLEKPGLHSDCEPAQSVSYVPHPSIDVAYEAACNPYRNSFFNKKPRVMVLMDLFKIQTVGQRYIACLSKLSLQIVVNNICFLPRGVFPHSHISGPVNYELIYYLSILRWRCGQCWN